MPYNILLVEDNKADRVLFDEFILKKRFEYDCTVAASYREAQRAIKEAGEFDVAVLNYALGDGCGVDLIPYLGDTPAIITTVVNDEKAAVKAMKLGAADYLVKDFASDYLKLLDECIKNAITIKILNKKNRILLNALKSISDSVYVTDLENNIIMVNEAFCESYGYSDGEILGKKPSILVGSRPKHRYGPGNPDNDAVYHQKKNGHKFPVITSESSVKDANGDTIGMIGVSQDISRDTLIEKKFSSTVDAAPNGILIVNEEGTISLANSQALKDFGYKREELIGQSIDLLVPKREGKGHEQHRHDYLANPKARPMGAGRELFAVRKDGSEFPVEIGLTPIEREDGTDIMAIVIDITRRKELEEEHRRMEAKLRQTQKLESLGVLAGGIAHDFNNILTGILGYLDLALMELDQNSDSRRFLVKMQKSALRAGELCRQMLAYSGKGKFVISQIDLNETLEEIAHLLKMSVAKSVTMHFKLDPNLPMVDADMTQIHQVLMNLIINASEALEGKPGTISITTGSKKCRGEELDDPHTSDRLPEGEYVFVEVADTGCGMEEETFKRIFDPFFTTKFTGRGLGLAAVLGIVRSHGGMIKVLSTPGSGTTFKILLPRSKSKKKQRETIPIPTDFTDIKGRILVVDDEEMILDVARTTLEYAHFEVMTAKDGKEGLEVFKENKDKIVLVVLDLTMPYLDGEKVVAKIQKLKPGMPTILMSGYNQQSLINQFVGQDVAAFLQKPLRPQMLLEAVKQILNYSSSNQIEDSRAS